MAAYRRLAAGGDCLAASKLAALTGEGRLAARGDPAYARRIYDDMADAFEVRAFCVFVVWVHLKTLLLLGGIF